MEVIVYTLLKIPSCFADKLKTKEKNSMLRYSHCLRRNYHVPVNSFSFMVSKLDSHQ